MNMKLSFLKLLIILTFIACESKSKEKKASPYADIINFTDTAHPDGVSDKQPKAKFDSRYIDFEEALAGDILEHAFKFKNTGDRDLYILDTKSSCGCTVPEYSKDPIKPGESSEIKVRFDTQGKKGAQDKKVSIFTNTKENEIILNIKANIISND